ncbi:MAG: amino acid ABC transporter permease [Hyphomicrobiales bacterium]|nr:amino acid ABC transporter permease [Hyphomicrobiales bacterium]
MSRRATYEAQQKRRALVIAAASTAAAAIAIFVLVPLAPGWPAVKASFFSVEIFAKSFPKMLSAFGLNVVIFLWSVPLVALVGLLIALCRSVTSPALFPLRIFGIAYVDVFRGLPVVLVIYLIGFGIPGLGIPRPWNSPYIWGTVALVLTYSAYVAEILRSGIESVHQSQRAAGLSLGFGERDVLRYIVLPQAVRRVVPANMNMLIAMQKDVALLSFIGPVEILRQAGIYKSLFANFTPYVVAAVIFLAVTIPATRYADYLMNKQRDERS